MVMHVPMPASVRTVVPALLAALALGATPARCFAGVRLSVCANQGPAACATCACSPARPPAALAAGGVRCSAGAGDGAPRHAGALPAVAAGLCLACAVALSAGPRSLQPRADPCRRARRAEPLLTADRHTTPRRPTGASWGGRAAHWPGDFQLKVRRVPFGRRQLGRRCSPPRHSPLPHLQTPRVLARLVCMHHKKTPHRRCACRCVR